MLSRLLRYDDKCEIVSPKSYRDEMKQILNDTLSDLLGKPADKKTVKDIEKIICDHDDIIGIHDLIIHDYGPGKAIGSCHVEVDANADFVKTHDLIDEIEKEIGTKSVLTRS